MLVQFPQVMWCWWPVVLHGCSPPPIGVCNHWWPLFCLQIDRGECNRAFDPPGSESSDDRLALAAPTVKLYMMDPDMNDSDVSTGNVDISRSVSETSNYTESREIMSG